jgi:hypothetical protein
MTTVATATYGFMVSRKIKAALGARQMSGLRTLPSKTNQNLCSLGYLLSARRKTTRPACSLLITAAGTYWLIQRLLPLNPNPNLNPNLNLNLNPNPNPPTASPRLCGEMTANGPERHPACSRIPNTKHGKLSQREIFGGQIPDMTIALVASNLKMARLPESGGWSKICMTNVNAGKPRSWPKRLLWLGIILLILLLILYFVGTSAAFLRSVILPGPANP